MLSSAHSLTYSTPVFWQLAMSLFSASFMKEGSRLRTSSSPTLLARHLSSPDTEPALGSFHSGLIHRHGAGAQVWLSVRLCAQGESHIGA